MKFKGTYPGLQKNRWFYTVWVALPEETRNTIQENLRELKPYCEWISTMAGNHSKDIPHISLRYLGFSDEVELEEVKKDADKFSNAIKTVQDLEIEVKDFNLWTKETNGVVTVARLNWQITNPKPFIELHNALLTVPNYYLFESLEQENYSPHISLGSVDMSNSNNYKIVKEYLENKEFEAMKYTLNDFALNLTSPEYTEVVSL